MLPEHSPRRPDQRRTLAIKNQHFRARWMSSASPAINAGGYRWQTKRGERIFHRQHKAFSIICATRAGIRWRNMKIRRAWFQILPHGEFVIERKSLRHIPDPATGTMSPGSPVASQPPAFAGGSRPVSITVVDLPQPFGTKESQYPAARNAEINMVNRDELTEAHGRDLSPHGNLFPAQRDRRSPPAYARALRFWQQGDKRLFQRRAMGFCPQLRAAGCQYLRPHSSPPASQNAPPLP